MTTPYTPEERERATEQLNAMMSMRGTSAENINSAYCRLNRLERREAEARELLNNAHPYKLPNVHHEAVWGIIYLTPARELCTITSSEAIAPKEKRK